METVDQLGGNDLRGGRRCALYSLVLAITSVISHVWGDGLRLEWQRSRARYTLAVQQHHFYGAPLPHRPPAPPTWLFSDLIVVSFACALIALFVAGVAITKGARLLGTLLLLGEVLLFLSVFGTILD